ncbi:MULTISPECIES: ABC transporter permease [unclassified Bradyrhizobium]|uniref:ABC transporter permease n=2 Tax=unclassified Bradyrhizobium TaxID=2631580 RepID=UPI0028EFF3F0|nr:MULTISPECIES: ABC transporter permease [unclassified Bradyrhizobium]
MSGSVEIAGSVTPSWSVRSVMESYGTALALPLLLALGGVISPAFVSPGNLSNLLLQVAPLAIAAMGQSLVMIVRGLDLSVASMMATAAVIATGFSGLDQNVPAIVATALVVAVSVGLLNGFLVTKRQVSPFLATLATMILLQGFRFAYTQGAPSGNVPPVLRLLGSGKFHGVPYNVLVLLFVAVLLAGVLHRSAFGRRIFIVGGNPVTGRLFGIRSDAVMIGCYLISSCLAALAGLILSGYVGLVDNWVGQGYELDSIVACVVGRVSLRGGRGSILGALTGAAIIVILANEVVLLGVPVQVQLIIKGVVIVLAAAIYTRRDAP